MAVSIYNQILAFLSLILWMCILRLKNVSVGDFLHLLSRHFGLSLIGRILINVLFFFFVHTALQFVSSSSLIESRSNPVRNFRSTYLLNIIF